jgi:hypothetical protein
MGDAEDRAETLRKLAVDLAKDGHTEQAQKVADLGQSMEQDAKRAPGVGRLLLRVWDKALRYLHPARPVPGMGSEVEE